MDWSKSVYHSKGKADASSHCSCDDVADSNVIEERGCWESDFSIAECRSAKLSSCDDDRRVTFSADSVLGIRAWYGIMRNAANR